MAETLPQEGVDKTPKPQARAARQEKRSYDEVLSMYEQARGTRDYFEMERDLIQLASMKPGDDGYDSWQEVRDAYPGWEKRDFLKLLAELGTALGGPLAKDVLRQKESELNAMQTELGRKEFELKDARDAERWSTIDRSPEEMVAYHRQVLAGEEADLKGMGFFARYVTDRDRARNMKENIRKAKASIEERENFIANSPVEGRNAKKEAERAERASTIQRLESEIEQLRKAIEKTRDSLK